MRKKMTKGKIYCLTAVAIILGSYIIQKILHIVFDITREFAIIEAIVFTVATVIVFFLVTKSKETFYGILTAIFGFRMMPPDISNLAKLSPEANIVYFIVQKFSLLIFALAILWLYEQQEKPKQLKALPILCTMVVVPFFMDTQSEIAVYINSIANGNLIYSYFTGFIFYSLSMIILLFVATRTNVTGAKLIIDFQFVALLLNFGRRVCAVAINLAQGNHISRSYYCWIAIYIFFFIAFYVLRKKKTSKA